MFGEPLPPTDTTFYIGDLSGKPMLSLHIFAFSKSFSLLEVLIVLALMVIGQHCSPETSIKMLDLNYPIGQLSDFLLTSA